MLVTDAEQREATVDPDRFSKPPRIGSPCVTEFTAAVVELWQAWVAENVEPVRRESRTMDACPRVPSLVSGPPLVAALSRYSLPHRFAARSRISCSSRHSRWHRHSRSARSYGNSRPGGAVYRRRERVGVTSMFTQSAPSQAEIPAAITPVAVPGAADSS
ncbi:hypothetical protein [Amycolatopsis sp. GM8]|uniref:hypothetical protein n=1 Tax=Amycolatopsis sp. GM8 TaxID=2896530 RepID=UPI001F2B5334|nr:hypothetical protein [Amycolatopsis sp. GM8]